ncbi:TIGR02302 family protein [Tropicimonas isoalkanivorans]|uniref:TIGR02302 family protein n=1 Tax=Tropicimonas isoalkanivorans TaxID=441112 RepID=A0A1I1N4H6_9RHOB|nr:TIGR02302 family protein [Tropicimonas isoalkanivorans]SFC92256.1 TIGR02302 family protein [Tropicimonas isoalkanivorans]
MELDATRTRALRRLIRPLRLTRAGMVAERLTRSFWPVWTIIFAVAGILMLGLHENAPVEIVWIGALIATGALVWFAIAGLRSFHWPSRAEAVARLDATLPGRPLQALEDVQAVGAGDDASAAVWAAHLERMTERAAKARRVPPDLRLARRDPFALRYVALVALVVGLLFGSVWRVASVSGAVAPGTGVDLAGGPAWEGWVEPPAYTGLPSLYLNDIDPGVLKTPVGSRVTLRLYGTVGALSVDESVSGRSADAATPATEPSQDFEIAQGGRLSVEGPGGREWRVEVTTDAPPSIAFEGDMEREANGQMTQAFRATDDFGVIAGRAEITLDEDAIQRRYGLEVEPDPREPITLDLPMTIAGDRREFVETMEADFSKHPWVGLPVNITLTAVDDPGQEGASVPLEIALPGRRFFDPLAAALIEQRRDLLWARANALRVAQILRAVIDRPEEIMRDGGHYLPLRVAILRLEAAVRAPGGLSAETQEEVAEALWTIALTIEEGDLSDALERLRRAQDRLTEAIRNGATDEEIADLMDEFREALQDYMRQLAQQQRQTDEERELSENMQTMTGDQLQQLLDRLQQLMEEGRTEEAMALMEQLRQMMENMQVAQGQQGQQGQSPGDQAMQGLAETLRDQQGLSDEAFRDLQDQFNTNPGEQDGQQPGQQQGQSGNGQPRGAPGTGQQPGQPGEQGEPDARSLAQRQGALRQRLEELRRDLPGAGTEPGDAARDSLGRAEGHMDRAEDALEGNELAEAIDEQSRAMEEMREGMRALGEAMAQQQQQQQGQEGEQFGSADGNRQRDPLGREAGSSGSFGSEENLLQGEDIYRRARDLLDELRRRSSDRERPELELDYLRRLLDRF